MCSCDTDGEHPDIREITFPVASREYRCSECCGRIAVGEQHQNARYFYAGLGWDEFRFCATCVRARAAHRKADPHCSPALEELRECIRENVKETPGYLEKFRAAWREMNEAA